MKLCLEFQTAEILKLLVDRLTDDISVLSWTEYSSDGQLIDFRFKITLFLFLYFLLCGVITFFFFQYVIQTRLPTPKTGRLLKPFLISVCLTWCLVCSFSRITDRRHHWWDVLAGIVLGILGVIYTIRLIDGKVKRIFDSTQISSSTTTLLDVKNKDATSVII